MQQNKFFFFRMIKKNFAKKCLEVFAEIFAEMIENQDDGKNF